jgi:hypothetical protein
VELAKGTGFILGKVIDAGGSQPVGGVIVTLTGFVEPPASPGSSSPPASSLAPSVPRRVVTGPDGHFLFRDLPAARFSITTAATGYVPGGYQQNRPGATARFLDLQSNEKRGDVQIRIWKFGAISGTVLDEAGEPAVGAAVRLFTKDVVTTAGPRIGAVTLVNADDRGVFRFGSVAPGEYLVAVLSSTSTVSIATVESFAEAVTNGPTNALPMLDLLFAGASPPTGMGFRIGDHQIEGGMQIAYPMPQPTDDGKVLVYAPQFYPNAASPSQATVVTVGSGEERSGVDLQLRLVTTARVSGVLTGPEGPAANFGVKLLPPAADDFTSESGIEAAIAVTDANGAFTFLGVPAGQYLLRALRVPRSAAQVAAPNAVLWASAPVTVGSADINGLAVSLKPGVRISGHFEFVGARPRPPGRLMSGGAVDVLLIGPRPSLPANSTRPSEEGVFTTIGHAPGRYFVRASVSGWMLKSVMLAGRNIADEPLELEATDLSDVVVTFTDSMAELSGMVLNARGDRDKNAEVVVFPADSTSWRRGVFSNRRVRLAGAAESGFYKIDALPAGEYFVAAVDDSTAGSWQTPAFLQKLQATAMRVTLADGEKKSLELRSR